MQIYAWDNKKPILATEAKRHQDYICPECLSPLRLRGGPHRQIHFYHLRDHPSCRQHKKSLTHLHIQLLLQSLVEDAQIERAFPEIGRIADVVWESKKIVIEIQCSPISLQEAEERCRDYEAIGFTPIWILHDKRFNQKKMSAAEVYLRTRTCYFTNIERENQGIIYDQFEICRAAKRLYRSSPSQVNLLELPSKTKRIVLESRIPTSFSFKRLYQALFRSLLERLCEE